MSERPEDERTSHSNSDPPGSMPLISPEEYLRSEPGELRSAWSLFWGSDPHWVPFLRVLRALLRMACVVLALLSLPLAQLLVVGAASAIARWPTMRLAMAIPATAVAMYLDTTVGTLLAAALALDGVLGLGLSRGDEGSRREAVLDWRRRKRRQLVSHWFDPSPNSRPTVVEMDRTALAYVDRDAHEVANTWADHGLARAIGAMVESLHRWRTKSWPGYRSNLNDLLISAAHRIDLHTGFVTWTWVAIAVGGGWLIGPTKPLVFPLVGSDPAWLSAAPVTAGVACLAIRRRRVRWFTLVLTLVVAFLSGSLMAYLFGILAGVIARRHRLRIERRAMRARRPVPYVRASDLRRRNRSASSRYRYAWTLGFGMHPGAAADVALQARDLANAGSSTSLSIRSAALACALLRRSGRFQEAIEVGEAAEQSLPEIEALSRSQQTLVATLHTQVGLTYLDMRRTDEAIALLTAARELGFGRSASMRRTRADAGIALMRALITADRIEEAAVSAGEVERELVAQRSSLDILELRLAFVEGAVRRRGDDQAELRRLLEELSTSARVDPDRDDTSRETLRRLTAIVARIEFCVAELDRVKGQLEQASEHYEESAAFFTELEADRFAGAVASTWWRICQSRLEMTASSLSALIDAARAVEAVRGSLHEASGRSALVTDLSELFGACLVEAARANASGLPRSGRFAVELVESLRRDALATHFRSGSLDLPPEARKLVSQITALEAGLRLANGPEGSEDRHAIDVDALDDELRTVRQDLRTAMSRYFAATIDPQPADVDAMMQALGRRHGLLVHLSRTGPQGWGGYSIWLRPGGIEPRVHEFSIKPDARIDSPFAILTELSEGRSWVTRLACIEDRWRELGTHLLPLPLRELLGSADEGRVNLVVVLDGRLASLPFGALELEEGPLLARALVSQVPSLSLLDVASDASLETHGALVHLDTSLAGTDEEGRAWHLVSNRLAPAATCETKAALEHALLNGPTNLRAVYVSAHGRGQELEQGVHFADGTRLSTADALTYEWPPLVVFGSCWVNRVVAEAGVEPVSLPVACLARGARLVVGGLFEVESTGTANVLSRWIAKVDDESSPLEALREAQLEVRAAAIKGRSSPALLAPAVWCGLTAMVR